jgi:hypothetical protein
MKISTLTLSLCLMIVALGSSTSVLASHTVDGELRRFHRIGITFDGPTACEDDALNPFLDYRLTVTFTKDTTVFVVPGFFAADGDAAQTSATCGDKWRVYFTPPTAGIWNWTAEFVTGTEAAIDPLVGSSTSFDGESGSLDVGFTNKKNGRDLRGKGRLTYKDRRYLKWSHSKDFFIMSGAGSPENLLAYVDFDGTYNNAGESFVKTYSSHMSDWTTDDPTWQGTKGKGFIGAMNYLASQGVNSQYFLTFNVDGDGEDVWPWTGPTSYLEYDVSKLDQWEIIFEHMDHIGMVKHFILQEQENDQHLNSGDLGAERKLYYRELIARFGHHMGVIWNLGEENTNTDIQRKAHATYIRNLDPYKNLIQTHTNTFEKNDVYTPLLAYPDYDGASLQVASAGWVDDDTWTWVDQSETSGRPWVVFMSEIGPASAGVVPDSYDPDHDDIRRDFLWVHLMHGGAGVEWYFGYDYYHNDLTCEDFRSRENMWEQTKIAREFWAQIPFQRMRSRNDLVDRWQTYCFAAQDFYLVHLPNGDYTDLTLTDTGNYVMGWFDPRNGGDLVNVQSFHMAAAGDYRVENPPTTEDWVAAILRSDADVSGLKLNFNEVTSSRVYPNPTTGLSIVEVDEWNGVDALSIQLFNLQGQLILEQHEGVDDRFELNLSNYPEGIYIYKVYANRNREIAVGRIARIRD